MTDNTYWGKKDVLRFGPYATDECTVTARYLRDGRVAVHINGSIDTINKLVGTELADAIKQCIEKRRWLP